MRDAFISQLTEIAAVDPNVVLITGDLGFGVLTDFARRFPNQFVNAGVAEQNMIGLATGMALEGCTVFTYSIANFAFMRCLEQIRNDAAYHDCNVNVVAIGGGFSYGSLGISHHATEDLAIMRSLPGLTVVSPCDAWETTQATSALAHGRGASYLRLDKSCADTSLAPPCQFELGRSRILREGDDVTLITTGGIAGECLKAAELLDAEGVKCRVLSMHTVKPIDSEAVIAAAIETGGVLTVEEHTVDGGLGGAVAETLLESDARVGFFQRIGLRDGFSSVVGSQDYLRKVYGLDAAAITAAVLKKARPTQRASIDRLAA